MNRAIFLDRDNTLIHNDGDLGDPSQVKLIQGVASAIASLRGLGYRIIVVSNQGGVARGKFTEAEVEATNARVNELIVQISGAGIDRFYYCPYHPQGTVEKYRSEHPWRKPQPGMLLQAARDMQLEMGQSWMVGDQLRDVEAGAAAGVRTILLTPQAGAAQPPLLQERMAAELLGQPADKNSTLPSDKPRVMPDFVARNLIEAVRIIAQQRRPEGVDDWRSLEPAKSPRPLPVALSPATQRLSQTTTPPSTATANNVTTSAMTPTPATGATSTMAATLTTGSPSTAKPVASTPAATVAPAAATELASTTPVEAVRTVSLIASMKPVSETSADTPSVSSTAVIKTTPATPSALVAAPTASASDTDTTSAREPGVTVSKPFTSDIAATTSTTTVATPPISDASHTITVTSPAQVTPHAVTTSTTATELIATSASPVTATSKPPASAPPVRPVQPMVSPALPATVGSPSMEQTLRQILAELRNQRQPIDEFNYTGVLAIVFQLLAVVCLLAALWMGRGDDGLFLRWMGVSLLTQLIAIAMLLFKR